MRSLTGLGVCVWFLAHGIVHCQSSAPAPSFEARDDYPAAISFFAPLVFPKIFQDEYRLKEFICGDDFRAFRRTYGDARAVDAIFDRALKLSWNNTYEALLLSFLVTMEHRRFGVRIPLLGPLLWVPLTSEFPDEFSRRVNALPARLYDDTPPGKAGDRDKLQHFFGSALITYTTESPDAAQRVGLFIEWGEDRFIVDGQLDPRDIRANVQGQNFGTSLLKGESPRPSRFLKAEDLKPFEGYGCVPAQGRTSDDPFAEER